MDSLSAGSETHRWIGALAALLLFVSCSMIQQNEASDKTDSAVTLLLAGYLLSAQSTVPTVQRNSTYNVVKTTHVYAQALSHSNWGTATTSVVDLSLDLYRPENAPGNRPAMILIHGGGFMTGAKDDASMVDMANYFASRGWVCVSIDYRLAAARGTLSTAWGNYVLANVVSTEREQSYAMYPAARDAKAAVRWLYANAGTYGINI